MNRQILEKVIREELEKTAEKRLFEFKMESLINKEFRQQLQYQVELFLKEGFTLDQIAEFLGRKINSVLEISTTGTGATFSPGQGVQYATPKAFKKNLKKEHK